ncbi:helix-turn-helix transcriptional regulator [Paenibacillus hemerocallicola]|uniref:Helix-turn-helix transcriptional regulator n=1 Tax=Paenibacillus hemerocallicola TaxID=1172614 RepID=A0A5C4T3X4_9BACL|nr:helix-turn-helix transcriptional regulator [Paenibacillus hemerocallicola]TNJ63774.1 helix-turn-helix transcriptional regulator [Paenibacillus hemerocallicola]
MSENVLKFVGARIRDLRKERGLSQEQLGEKAGFHFSYIGGIERAEKNISLLNLAKIADALDVEIHELFGYSYSMKMELSDKEEEITEILDILLRQDLNDLKRVKTIIKEVLRD